MKFKVPVGIKKILVKAEKNSPAILTGLGIAGGITTTVLAVKATPKALKLIEEAEKEKNKARKADEPNIKLTTPEVIKAVLHWHDELSDDHPEIEEYYVDNVVYSLKPAIYRGFQFELKKANKYRKEFFYGHAFLYSRKPIQQSIKETPTTISGIIPVSNRFDFGCDEDLKTDKMLKLIHDTYDLIK